MSVFDKFDKLILRNIRVEHIIDKDQNKDSFEIGTAGRQGVIKIYGNFNRPEDFKRTFDNAINVRNYAIKQIEMSNNLISNVSKDKN